MASILEHNRQVCRAWKGPRSVCRCGHLGDGEGSQHAGAGGDGKCLADGCGCERFLWDRFVPELEPRLLSLRGQADG